MQYIISLDLQPGGLPSQEYFPFGFRLIFRGYVGLGEGNMLDLLKKAL